MNEIRKALETIALQNSKGLVSDEILEKACEAYKNKIKDFDDSYDYQVRVSKSFFDYINGKEPDEEICKAVVPGQTKVVDGVIYIYTATPGAKTQYDWRVFKGKNKTKLTEKQIKDKQNHVNNLFPADLSGLKFVKKLGGSTGAELVEDKDGVQYVKKEGASPGHVKSEFLANQLYSALGVRVPDFELYEENGKDVMLSRFIPLTRPATASDYPAMAKNFMSDVFLANWDVYQNDNVLIDSAGRVVRVDNGGSLSYRAQGGQKTFTSSSLETDFENMKKYNPTVTASLTDQDYINQIDDILSRKELVFDFIEDSPIDSKQKAVLKNRFMNLITLRNDLQTSINAQQRKVPERNLKPESEMYREFTEDEIQDFWKSVDGNYYEKVESTNSNGWELLGNICRARGFDARPKVVDDQEYWELIKGGSIQLFRGVTTYGNSTKFVDDFKYNDNCFYGTVGIYGSGIYAHVNNGRDSSNTPTTYDRSSAFQRAVSYAGGSRKGVMLLSLDPSAKIGKVDELVEEIKSYNSNNDPEFQKKKDEIDELINERNKKKDELDNLSKNLVDNIKRSMHWDDDTLVGHQIEIENTNWSAITPEGKPDYPTFDDFVKGKMFDWVTKNGGTIKEKGKDTDIFVFKLPNSKETFEISRFRYENNAIKQKNVATPAYNYPVRQFSQWLIKNHYVIIENRIKQETEKLGEKTKLLSSQIKKLNDEIRIGKDELNNMMTVNSDKDLMSGIKKYILRHDMDDNVEPVGVYAALKGYDAIIKERPGGCDNSYCIILNRSKVIVKK